MSIMRPSMIEQTVGIAFIDPGTAMLVGTGISALVGAGGSFLGGSAAAKGAEDAAEIAAQGQMDATRLATDTMLEMYYQSRADTAPWLQAGVNALGTLTGTTPTGIGGEPYDPTPLAQRTGTGYTSPKHVNAGFVMDALKRMESGDMFIQKANQGWEQEALKLFNLGIKSTDLQQETVGGTLRLTTPPPAQVQGERVSGNIPPPQTGGPGPVPTTTGTGTTKLEQNRDRFMAMVNDPATTPEDKAKYQGYVDQYNNMIAQQTGAPAPTGGLIAGPDEPYTGTTPTNILNQGFTPTGSAVTAGQFLEQQPFQHTGPDPNNVLNQGFNYRGTSPTDLLRDPYKREEFNFETAPGYQFRLSEGQKALDRAQAARGNFLGGRAVKEALRYNQGFASNEYGNAFNRYAQMDAADRADWLNRYNATAQDYGQQYGQYADRYNMAADAQQRAWNQYGDQYNMNQMAYNQDWGRHMDTYNMARADYGDYYGRYLDKVNRYMSLAGAGQVTASNNASAAMNVGSNVANAQFQGTSGAANAMAAGQFNQGNANAAMYTGIANAFNQGIGNYLTYDYLNRNPGGTVGNNSLYPDYQTPVSPINYRV